MKTPTETLITALEKLSVDIHTDDGVVNACLAEAAMRMRELHEFVGDLVEIEFNDTDAAYWRREAIRIPSGETLYVGGNKPELK